MLLLRKTIRHLLVTRFYLSFSFRASGTVYTAIDIATGQEVSEIGVGGRAEREICENSRLFLAVGWKKLLLQRVRMIAPAEQGCKWP